MKKTLIAAGLIALAGGTALAQPVRADANRDGALTRAEFAVRIDQRFATLDVNRDGRLTQDERQAKREDKRGMHRGRHGGGEARFERFDRDGNGQISRAEFAAHAAERKQRRGMRAERGGPGGGRAGLATRVDANGDGMVTKAEFAQRAYAHFARKDVNKDGRLTRDERQAARAERRGG